MNTFVFKFIENKGTTKNWSLQATVAFLPHVGAKNYSTAFTSCQ
jgi:hypothetical protein